MAATGNGRLQARVGAVKGGQVDTRSTNEPISETKSGEAGEAAASWNGGARLEVIANLAHELRTPIQVVMGYLEILRDEYESELGAEPRKLLERMNSNVHDLARTIDNMMEFVMAGGNAGAMVAEELTPASLMADVTSAIDAANQVKRLQLNYDLKGAPKMIRAPRRALRSILLNLALNAIKFTPSGSVTIAIRSALGRGRQDALEIEVTDTGPGMSPALLEQAAKPFTQLSKASVRRYRGLGLGLAVVQRNLKALGGTLELRPAPGHGASFVVRIPQGIQLGTVKPATPITPRRNALMPADPSRKGPPSLPRPLRPA
jgi:signal transduction histidine kinase